MTCKFRFLIIFFSEYKKATERERENINFGCLDLMIVVDRSITKQPMTIAAKMREEKKKALRPRFKLYDFFLFGIVIDISRRQKKSRMNIVVLTVTVGTHTREKKKHD